MKTFSYHSPKDVKEASQLASSSSMFLAGGMTSIPSMKLGMATYKDVIDLKKIKKLSGIKVSSKTVTIGATTKHAEVAASKDVQKAIPALAKLAGNIGDAQVRNRGTIGGSISNNDPSACYPSACMALNAVIHTNGRKIEADKFFKGMFETALKKGEIVEAVEFQIPEKADYQKHPNPASRYAIVGVFVAKHKDEVNVAVTGAKSCSLYR
jgi:carbon-monoxide dehydrogenase medium subunit